MEGALTTPLEKDYIKKINAPSVRHNFFICIDYIKHNKAITQIEHNTINVCYFKSD